MLVRLLVLSRKVVLAVDLLGGGEGRGGVVVRGYSSQFEIAAGDLKVNTPFDPLPLGKGTAACS